MEELIVTEPALHASTGGARSAVAWAAILSGAAVAAATSLVLLILFAGLGFGAVSPWPNAGASAAQVTALTAIGLIITQWLSASVGGYLTGRLRLKWTGTHTHEVFFRDTAHGFITWAVASLLVAVLVAAGAASLAGAGGRAAASAGPAVAAIAPSGTPYELETLFRSTSGADPKATGAAEARLQAGDILSQSMMSGALSATDHTYLAQLVAAQTGVPETEAQARVDQAMAQLKAADLKARTVADKARKDTELALILTALSMLIGAFIASVSAALGGRLRDLHP